MTELKTGNKPQDKNAKILSDFRTTFKCYEACGKILHGKLYEAYQSLKQDLSIPIRATAAEAAVIAWNYEKNNSKSHTVGGYGTVFGSLAPGEITGIKVGDSIYSNLLLNQKPSVIPQDKKDALSYYEYCCSLLDVHWVNSGNDREGNSNALSRVDERLPQEVREKFKGENNLTGQPTLLELARYVLHYEQNNPEPVKPALAFSNFNTRTPPLFGEWGGNKVSGANEPLSEGIRKSNPDDGLSGRPYGRPWNYSGGL